MSKSGLLPIDQRVQEMVDTHFAGHPKFVIGVSGGPDSMCLLHILNKLETDLVVVHINYSKRGKEADKDAELVENYASEWGFDCHVLEVDPNKANSNFQQWARNVRYEVFYSLMDEYGADGIAVAHHRDDQVETIVQKIFRGAGFASWSAMEAWDEESLIFRPLLRTTRHEIESYLEEEGIQYRLDKTNRSSEFARNFLRNEWLERLENHFPGWEGNILRAGGHARVFEKALEWISEQLTDEIDRVDRDELLALDPALQKSVILFLLKKADPGVEVSRHALNQLDSVSSLQTGKSIQITDRFLLMRDREAFKIVVDTSDELELVSLDQERLEAKPFNLDSLVFELEEPSSYDFESCLYLDADRLEWPVRIRRWRDGDRFQPLGMNGTQKISDHLTNRQVSAAQKHQSLALESGDGTISVVLFPPREKRRPPGTISEQVKCGDTTDLCLKISLEGEEKKKQSGGDK